MGIYARCHGEQPAFVKTTVGDQHMQVEVVAEQITEGLNGDDSSGHRGLMLRKETEIGFQSLPAAAAQIGEPAKVIQKAAPQDLGNTEDDVPVCHGLDDVTAQLLAEFHHALLVAGGTKMPPFAQKG